MTETVGAGAVVRHGRSAVEPEAHPRLASVPRPDAPRCELRTTDLASGEELQTGTGGSTTTRSMAAGIIAGLEHQVERRNVE